MRSTYESEKYQTNAPAPFEHSIRKVTNFAGLTGKNNTFQQLGQMFNPTTKAGIVNLMGMLAGGPKGDSLGEGAMESMGGKFEPYSPAKAAAGGHLSKDSTGRPIAMRILTNRAQGAGRYNRPEGGLAEMARIEALRNEQSRLSQIRDQVKDNVNASGLENRQSYTRMAMNHAYESKAGGALERYREQQGTPPNMDRQPADYRDRLTLLNLAKNNPTNTLLPGAAGQAALKQVLHDLLFGNFKGPKPPFPRQ